MTEKRLVTQRDERDPRSWCLLFFSRPTTMDTKDQALLADIKSFTLDEGENEVTQILSDDVLRAIRKKIRELDDYPMEETKNRAVIMLGRSGSGKSTACKVIKKITAAQESKSLFSTTVSPRFTSFSLDDRAHQIKYTLSVIDTPGVQEVCPEGQDPRSDDAILETVKYCLKNEVTRLHVLFIFAAFELRITPLDKEAFKVYLDMFYNEKLQIAFCITRAEGRGREWRAKVEEDLRKDSFFGPVLDRPNVKLFFCGVVEQRTIRNAPNPKSLLKKYSEILQVFFFFLSSPPDHLFLTFSRRCEKTSSILFLMPQMEVWNY